MHPNEQISMINQVLDFLKIEHRDMVIVNFIVLASIVLYAGRKLYLWKAACGSITCSNASKVIEKANSIDQKVQQLETLLVEIKTESGESHTQLRRELDRFDKYLKDLQSNTFELHGMLLGSSYGKGQTKRRIIHDED